MGWVSTRVCCPGLLLLFVAILAQTGGVVRAGGPILRLKYGDIDASTSSDEMSRHDRMLLTGSVENVVAMTSSHWGELEGRRQWLVTPLNGGGWQAHFTQTIDASGARIIGHVPDTSLLVLGPEDLPARLSSGVSVVGSTCPCLGNPVDGTIFVAAKHLVPYKPAYKLSPAWEQVFDHVLNGATLDSLGIATREEGNVARAGMVVAFAPRGALQSAHSAGFGASTDWAAPLRGRFGSETVQIGHASPHSITLWAPASVLKNLTAWLADQPGVHWVEPLSRLRLHNRQASAISQAGTVPSSSSDLQYTNPSFHPMWAAGLTGAGQVIGAGDSGVDRYHCFFYDPNVDWDSHVTMQAGVEVFSSTEHRKIRYYRAYGDMSDYNGHGTHTMGTLLGSMIGGLNYTASSSAATAAYGSAQTNDATTAQYIGMAPDAKLAFIDLADGASSSIYTPADIEGQYFAYTTSVGAVLHSDSWGGSTVQYDYLAAQVDDYHWKNPEFLAFFAAGNDGQLYGSGNSETTVTSPATAKNIVAVGATQTAGESLGTYASRYTTYDAVVTQAGETFMTFKVMQSAFGDGLDTLGGGEFVLATADPVLACSSPLNDASNLTGAVVLVERGSCYLSDKVGAVQSAGGTAALISDNVLGGYFVAGADSGSSVTLPSATITRRLGQTLRTALTSGLRLSIAFSPASAPPTSQSFENLASYSSQGPTPDGRVKPDLVAPGSLYSARRADSIGSQTCGLTGMQGTSMATPVSAGSAALVRQFYLEGRYQGNVTTSSQNPASQLNAGFTPSGALIKSTLMSGAASLSGYEALTGLPIDPPPSFRQGFGRVQLESTLPLSSADFSFQAVDRVELSQGNFHRYCLRSTGGPLTITLVWTDYPGLPSTSKALVNDLDLVVRAAGYSGIPLLGNGGSIANESMPDRENNVEQVSLAYVPAGAVSVEVSAYYIYPGAGRTQPYALTMNGAFAGTISAPGDNYQPEQCTIVVPEITSGPSGPTNQTPIQFGFGASSGTSQGLAWQCHLGDGNGNVGSTSGTQDWTSCTSPVSFPNLGDGTYVFSVRATGETSTANRTFTLDTTPPELSFGGSSTPSRGSTTDAAIANISFTGSDALAVTYACALSVESATTAQGSSVMYGDINVEPWQLGFPLQSCESPLAFHWLLPGEWTLSVQATDAAGNQAVVSNYTWTVGYTTGAPYARLASGLFGLSRLVEDVVFGFEILAQAGNGSVSSQVEGAECMLLQGLSSSLTSLTPSTWAPCSSPASLGNLSEGSYTFFARPASYSSVSNDDLRAAVSDGTGRIAASGFALDGTPPVVSFDSSISPIIAVTSVSARFSSNGVGTSFNCSLMGPGQNGSQTRCISPLQMQDLADGNFTLTIIPTDLVGNVGEPVSESFTVDATPPVFTSLSYPPATSGTSLTVDFSTGDGNGTGVAYTICRLISGDKIANSTGASDGNGFRNCTSPVTWTDLTEGHWLLSIDVFDRAGNENSTGDLDFWVDRTPPVISVSQGPSSYETVVGSLSFSFAELFSQGNNNSAAPVAAYQLRLRSISQDEFDRLENGTTGSDANGNTLSSVSDRHLLEVSTSQTQGSSTIQASDALAGWSNCSTTCSVDGLASGTYTYQARAVDLANNVGNATNEVPFTFQAVSSGFDSGSSFPTWAIGVIAGVGGAVLLALLLWCGCYCWRRRQPNHAAAPMPQQAGWPASVAAGSTAIQANHFYPHHQMAHAAAHGYAVNGVPGALEQQQIAYAMAMSEHHARQQAQRRQRDAEMEAALRASVQQSRPQGGYQEEDAQLKAAIEASLKEHNATQEFNPWRT